MAGRLSTGREFEFPFKLYNEIIKEDGNMFFSPYSISSALSMLLLGCGGESKTELQKALSADDSCHERDMNILEVLGEKSRFSEINIANRIFVQKKYKLLKKFYADCEKYYKSLPESLDFVKHPKSTADYINAWVEEMTKSKIKEICRETDFCPNTKLMLVNTIYFKGKWKDEFDYDCTRNEDFFISKSEKVKVKMMKCQTDYRHTVSEKLGVAMLEVPYRDGNLSMFVILPNEGNYSELTFEPKDFQDLESSLESKQVSFYFPKFKMEYGVGLIPHLESLGVYKIFTINADLKKISKESDLMVSGVMHKAFVEMTEEGTEAAAATGVVCMVDCYIEPVPSIDFKCNRPFMFLIKHKATGTILFMGKFEDPRRLE